MPDVAVYGVDSWKSTHEYVVPMFMEVDWASSVPGEFPLTAYSAAVAFPDDSPLM